MMLSPAVALMYGDAPFDTDSPGPAAADRFRTSLFSLGLLGYPLTGPLMDGLLFVGPLTDGLLLVGPLTDGLPLVGPLTDGLLFVDPLTDVLPVMAALIFSVVGASLGVFSPDVVRFIGDQDLLFPLGRVLCGVSPEPFGLAITDFKNLFAFSRVTASLSRGSRFGEW